MTWNFVAHLKDYCTNSTLAGLRYIANENLHFTERIFWLLCVILSALGSYHLISQFEKDFETKAVSIVYESVQPNEKIHFPSLSVCDMYNKFNVGLDIEAYVESLGIGFGEDYNYDVETHLAFLIYPYMYHEGTVQARCLQYQDCEECAKCPADGYMELLERFGVKCSEYFKNCSISGKPFDCCQYFLPYITPAGKCFLLNSLQNNEPGSKHWLNNAIDPAAEVAEMILVARRLMQLSIINQEDIPHTALPTISISLSEGHHKVFQVSVDNMLNDVDVREVSPQNRKCRFPDELLPNTVYKAYSFSTCLADCIRGHQLSICNCTQHLLVPSAANSTSVCGLKGYLCLEAASMIKPDAKMLLPWAHSNFSCDCLPSCTEHDLRAVYESEPDYNMDRTCSVKISVPFAPTLRYRRQALRTRLDVVVTIGGILGLFMGASLLSAIELVYYFTLRIVNNIRKENRTRKMQQQKRIVQTSKTTTKMSSLLNKNSPQAFGKAHSSGKKILN